LLLLLLVNPDKISQDSRRCNPCDEWHANYREQMVDAVRKCLLQLASRTEASSIEMELRAYPPKQKEAQ